MPKPVADCSAVPVVAVTCACSRQEAHAHVEEVGGGGGGGGGGGASATRSGRGWTNLGGGYTAWLCAIRLGSPPLKKFNSNLAICSDFGAKRNIDKADTPACIAYGQ